MTIRQHCESPLCLQQRDAIDRLDSSWGTSRVTIHVNEVDYNAKVTDMKIENGSFETLPANFSVLFPQVERLELVLCHNLTDVSPLCRMKHLTELRLGACWELQRLPSDLCRSTKLRTLALIRCSSFDYPSQLPLLTNITNLQIYDYDLELCPLEIFSLSNLKALHLFGAKWNCIPDEIGNLSRLEELCVFCEEIETLPKTIGNLENIEDLRLYECLKLANLPMELGRLTKLKFFDLYGCKALNTIPAVVLKLPELEFLGVAKCYNLLVPEKDVLECSTSLVSVDCAPDSHDDDANDYDHLCSDELKHTFALLEYVTKVNKTYRPILKEKDVPLALWSNIMGHCRNDKDLLLFYLKQKPDLVALRSRKRKAGGL